MYIYLLSCRQYLRSFERDENISLDLALYQLEK